MADGALNLNLTDYTASKIAEKAETMGISTTELAVMILDASVFDHEDFAWANGKPQDDHADNHDLNEAGRPWSDIRPELMARMKLKLSERG